VWWVCYYWFCWKFTAICSSERICANLSTIDKVIAKINRVSAFFDRPVYESAQLACQCLHQFSAHICCVQMAGWIKMPHDTEVGLDPGDFALYGDPAPPPQKGGGAPNFRPMSIVAKRLDMDQDGTWHGGGPRLGHSVLDGDSSPKQRGTHNFWPMSVVAKRLDGSRCHLVCR